MPPHFELLLFSVEERLIRRAVDAGVDGVIVDWENAGKHRRQVGADTQVNEHTVEDLCRVRAATATTVLCRVNNGPQTPAEIDLAIGAGADEVVLPMVTDLEQVHAALAAVRGRCKLAVLVETVAGVSLAPHLARLPVSRAYVGLNDLAIDRGDPNLFHAVADGTVARVRAAFRASGIPFGFGGLTLPERGVPIPCRLLMGEMARLKTDFTFLRRSFLADTAGRDLREDVGRMRQALAASWERDAALIAADQEALAAAIHAWTPVSRPVLA